MSDSLAERIITEGNMARAMRQPFDPRWQDIAELCAPELAQFTTLLSPGQQQGSRIRNSHGMRCTEDLAIRVDGFLTGGGTTWFDLRIPDSRVAEDYAVKEWLDHVKNTLYMVFNSPASGFEQAKESYYLQTVAFGNGPIYVEETPNGWPKFHPEYLGNCSVWADEDGWPNALFRRYQQTAWRLIQQFGKDAVPQEVREAMEKEPQKMFWCWHACRPVMENDPPDYLAGRKWINVYVLESDQSLLGPVRYDWEFPWIFGRWRVSPNEIYGRGPADRALAEVKMLQPMDTSLIKHIEMDVDATWVLPNDGGESPRINQRPGGIIYAEFSPNGTPLIQRLGPGGSSKHGMDFRAVKMDEVEALFYLHAFKLIEKVTNKGSVVNMSATEFAGRQAEQMRYAGPRLARQRAEFLFPVISRCARILVRNRKIPPPPWQLRGAPVHPEYVSPLAMAQRAGERSSILQYVNDIIPLAEIDPTALDFSLNVQRAAAALSRAHHVPQAILPTPEEIQAKMKARADAAQAQMRIEQMGTAAEAAKNNAQAMQMLRGTG